MRVAFIPWIALSAVVIGSGEVAAPCESVAQQEASEEVETITRDISLAEHARADSLHSLSGAIMLRRNSRVSGDVETTNGELVLEPGSEVCGRLRNVSGSIRIDAARVGGPVTTTYGDIYIGPDSRLEGGIVVDKRNVFGLTFGDLRLGVPLGRATPPRVVIGPRATVAGVLRFKREVQLLVSESATIGLIEGATPVMFATEQPPQ